MTLPCVETETGANPRHAVLWLHGLGADGNDFAPIVPELAGAGLPPIRFVFPHAPVRPVTINGGMPMRAWYDLTGLELARRQDEAGMRASLAEIEALIAREVGRGIAPANLVLAGFSQGAAMALAGGLRHAARLAGIIALSGYLPLHEKLADERAPANADVPILIAHGSVDPVVPEPLGMHARDFLRSLGYPVEWKSYAMAHQVCAEEIADLRAWLAARFA
ncbi:MAG TPA: carboxylesterase [Dokdonella sp.]|uniref:alpha/beta hydrolase n=1 Tax=Dokdonella sp. TaxID=2291710 RepID=UPI0025C14022|nr:carboxylesterase [Dokdonella sp.]MBX3691190.1 carboxylesterase [Dokdonella sp.]MCW5568870.1 carboxylesterase [Dokdonella sp.]HNR92860.1 carboxylesterase [Dokdonella sp.]